MGEDRYRPSWRSDKPVSREFVPALAAFVLALYIIISSIWTALPELSRDYVDPYNSAAFSAPVQSFDLPFKH